MLKHFGPDIHCIRSEAYKQNDDDADIWLESTATAAFAK